MAGLLDAQREVITDSLLGAQDALIDGRVAARHIPDSPFKRELQEMLGDIVVNLAILKQKVDRELR